ncbi:TlpA family protein disulfide reductase [Aminipila sp.]|uniref:TlpA family protein disulfide reductase n=1 Tax=Aminipila sp. TaxID=2060095 RepID=UPI0028998063|nr:TlpA disulfide reductase family protein [Aminipila sp.]
MKKIFLLLLVTTLTIFMIGCSQPNTGITLDKNKDNTFGAQETVQPVATKTQLGDFKAQDVNGKEITKDIFADYDLTLVNLFTTWCSPCIKEIPELNAVDKEMADKKVNIIGMVLDVNENGTIDKSKLDKLNKIIESTKAEYTMVLPDDVLRAGRLKGVDSVPESFFVDKDGNIVGKTYLGSHTKEEWIKIIEDELAKLKK